ncbi:hypothetical protein MSG28_005521 [Choristoneura fumiferana]|uniref:Uncharacterized protein n=1 Tax=Choristoneura fumiferana TaxID=7141 RepID=A0ACC0KZS7_CHOFU|nr:hypothetical protein MSG28_005521 [Choristoneura fumiferana]
MPNFKSIGPLKVGHSERRPVPSSVFLIEAGLRMMASGISSYLESGWNVFDLSVTLLALMGAVMLTIAPKLFIVVIFRPLRTYAFAIVVIKKRAWAIVPTRAQCRLGTSHAPLNCFQVVDASVQAKKRYRDVFGTLVLLSPLMSSAGCVMLVMYYFFAIIGMELFAGLDLKNCCK